MGLMRVMGSKRIIETCLPETVKEKVAVKGGDTTIAWPEEITEDEAKEAFDQLIEFNYNAFDISGGAGTQIRDFDAEAQILLAPPMAGG